MVNPSFSFVPSIRQLDSLCGPIISLAAAGTHARPERVGRAAVGQAEELAALISADRVSYPDDG